jgi:Fe2+ or Zn2+ uptake regulation protein
MAAHTTSPTDPDARLREALRDAGLRVTTQRVVLHRVVLELGRHASAEEITAAASERLPGLSLPTVYATLELLERLGLLRRITGAGPAALYDAGAEPHAHLLCSSCGAVVDVPGEADVAALWRAARRAGLAVEGAEVVLHGKCAACGSD